MEMKNVKEHLEECVILKDLGSAKVFIGMNMTRDRIKRVIYIDQAHYGKAMLSRYGMSECNPISIPMQPGKKLCKAGTVLSTNETKLFQAMVGSIGYMMNCTRPNLAYALGKVAQFVSNPTEKHLATVKQIFRYIKGSLNTKLCISLKNPQGDRVLAFFDFSWADDIEDKRSTFGYVVLFGTTPLIWKSRKHKVISLSTTDTEYVAATEVTRDICHVQNLFESIGIILQKPVILYGDNFNANGSYTIFYMMLALPQ